MIPDFPTIAGEEASVEFSKDGRRYRMMRLDDDTLVMHQAGATAEEFELLISNFSRDGLVFDVQGVTGRGTSLDALGATRGQLARLF